MSLLGAASIFMPTNAHADESDASIWVNVYTVPWDAAPNSIAGAKPSGQWEIKATTTGTSISPISGSTSYAEKGFGDPQVESDRGGMGFEVVFPGNYTEVTLNLTNKPGFELAPVATKNGVVHENTDGVDGKSITVTNAGPLGLSFEIEKGQKLSVDVYCREPSSSAKVITNASCREYDDSSYTTPIKLNYDLVLANGYRETVPTGFEVYGITPVNGAVFAWDSPKGYRLEEITVNGSPQALGSTTTVDLSPILNEIELHYVKLPASSLVGGTLPDAELNQAYVHSIADKVSGGVAPYGFALKSGSSLPPGLYLATDGTISGTPIGTVSKYSFSVVLTDANGMEDTAEYTLSVNLPINTDPPGNNSLPAGDKGSGTLANTGDHNIAAGKIFIVAGLLATFLVFGVVAFLGKRNSFTG